MSSPRVEALLVAVAVAFRLTPDTPRAERILESAMRDLLAGHPRHHAVDAIGAPLLPRRPDTVAWWELRGAVKELVRHIGLDEAARRFGTAPETLRHVICRRREPGTGRKARLMAMLAREAANDAEKPAIIGRSATS